jgi:hypothetical protein
LREIFKPENYIKNKGSNIIDNFFEKRHEAVLFSNLSIELA